MFAFRTLIKQAQIWKSFWVQNSTSLLYYPLLHGWNLENLYKQAESIFFRLSWHFKGEKIRILESILLQNKIWLRTVNSLLINLYGLYMGVPPG